VKITNSGRGGTCSNWGVQALQKKVVELKPDAGFFELAVEER